MPTIVRTPMYKFYLKRLPDLMLWGTFVSGILYWPRIFPTYENYKNDIPDINCQTFIDNKPIYS
jgi:hypothetical protein